MSASLRTQQNQTLYSQRRRRELRRAAFCGLKNVAQAGLRLRTWLRKHAPVLSRSGMNWPQSRCASPLQACSGDICAEAGAGEKAKTVNAIKAAAAGTVSSMRK